MSHDPTLSYTVPHPSLITSPSDTDPYAPPPTLKSSLPSTTYTSETVILHPRKFDLYNDTELYLHEDRVISRLLYYEPRLHVTRLKHVYLGDFVGNPGTLVVSVAGASAPIAGQDDKFRSAYSVFYGPKSRYNTTGKVKETGGKIEMQKIAELAAACEALEFVEMEMRMVVRGFEGVDGGEGEAKGLELVVVKTASTNLWNGIVEHIYKWKRNDFHNTRGGKVAGEALWLKLDELMLRFESGRTRVAWWLVEKEENEAEEGAWLRATDALL
ncbi:Ribonuclease H1 protein [Rutstroemia sp. NJR-2017a BBW]|nr:Ribonuclease H1 protein [Rutstroemia sp. NJR-2017a BBW]